MLMLVLHFRAILRLSVLQVLWSCETRHLWRLVLIQLKFVLQLLEQRFLVVSHVLGELDLVLDLVEDLVVGLVDAINPILAEYLSFY